MSTYGNSHQPRRGRSVATPLYAMSTLVHRPLHDARGRRVGHTEDLVVEPVGDGDAPFLSGICAVIDEQRHCIPIAHVSNLTRSGTTLSSSVAEVERFAERPAALHLRRDVLGRSMINVQTARLVRAQEILIARGQSNWQIVGIDTSLRARLKRLLPFPHRTASPSRRLVAWADLEPFVGSTRTSPTVRRAHRRLARLHPAQLADLVEAADRHEGEEIFAAAAQTDGLQADLLEELDDHHRVESLRARTDAQAANLLSQLPSDDAVDLLLELEQPRRVRVLELLPEAMRSKVRALLNYNPQTAGGLMTADFISLPGDSTVADARTMIQFSDARSQDLHALYTVDAQDRPVGAVLMADLVRAPDDSPVHVLAHATPVANVAADIPEVAQLMCDYDLVSMPIVDDDGHITGVLTLDDLIEHLLPSDWRRRRGSARD